MPWAKFSDDAQRSERILALSVPARWFWAAAIMENRGYTVPGCPRGRSPFISKVRAEALARQQDVPLKVIKELEDAGRWEPVEGGWNIHHYEEFLPTQRELLADHQPDPVKQAAGAKGAAKRWQADSTTDSTYIRKSDGKAIAGHQQTDDPTRARALGPVPVPTPIPSTQETLNAPLPSLPLDASGLRKDAVASDLDEGLKLAVKIGEFMGEDLKALEIEACRQWMAEFSYLTVDSAMERIVEYAAKRAESNLEPIRSVLAFRRTLQAQNDWLCDQGAPKQDHRQDGRQSGMSALGDLLPRAKEASS